MVESERVPVERKRRRPTSSGVVLSADLIVDAACELIDAQGAQAFTVRKLGAALGADPSAVYRYFRNTEDLLLALADRLIGESMAGFAPSGDWAADLRDFGLRAYRSALRHPQIAVFSTVRVTGRPMSSTRSTRASVCCSRPGSTRPVPSATTTHSSTPSWATRHWTPAYCGWLPLSAWRTSRPGGTGTPVCPRRSSPACTASGTTFRSWRARRSSPRSICSLRPCGERPGSWRRGDGVTGRRSNGGDPGISFTRVQT